MNLFQRQVLDQLGNENVLVECGQALEGGEQVEHVLLVTRAANRPRRIGCSCARLSVVYQKERGNLSLLGSGE